MPRASLLLAALAAFLAIAPNARGQTVLDKLEKKVNKALGARGAAPVDPSATAPAPTADAELPPPSPDASAPRPGYLGIVLEEIEGGGIRVAEVSKDSPAAKAGLKAGDKITAVNKKAVTDIGELGALLEPIPAGGKVKLTVVRDGKDIAVEATLGQPPSEPSRRDPSGIELGGPLGPGADVLPPPGSPRSPAAPRGDEGRQRASLGITVVTYNDELRLRSDVPARGGAMISDIRAGSPADRAGLPRGGVIVAYDGQRIDTADQLVDAIRASRPGQKVELSYYQGGQLRRREVTLTAAADPGLLTPGFGGGALRDRPLLGRVERAIEGLTRPEAAPGAVPAEVPEAAGAASLQEEVASLKAKIEALEARLAELESKLAPEKPALDDGAGPARVRPATAPAVIPKDDAGPGLEAPTLKPPKKPVGAKIGDK